MESTRTVSSPVRVPEKCSLGTDDIASIKASIDFIRLCTYIVSSDVNLNSTFTVLQMAKLLFPWSRFVMIRPAIRIFWVSSGVS